MVYIAVQNLQIRQALEYLVAASGFDAVACVCAPEEARGRDHVLAVGDFSGNGRAAYVFAKGFRLGAVIDRLAVMVAGLQSDPDIAFQDYTLRSRDNVLVRAGGAGAGQEIILTDTEKRLLLVLAAAGEALSREALLEKVWGYRPGVDTHTVETHIYRLRKKIEADTARPAYILTVADGYCLKA